jgi:hypothetical protein
MTSWNPVERRWVQATECTSIDRKNRLVEEIGGNSDGDALVPAGK